MGIAAFDTYAAVKAITGAGAEEPLAEAIVSTLNDAIVENLATKAELHCAMTVLFVGMVGAVTTIVGGMAALMKPFS